jgi:hypothetical protein
MSINWTPWSFPAQGGTAPGSSITVLPTSTAGQYALFISDPNGYIYTAAGNTQVGWGEWSWVAQGQAAPKSPVTAVPLANAVNEYALFIASPTGEVMTTAGGVQRGWNGWTSVAEGSTTPGQLITAAPINAELDQYALFITDPNGYTYWIAGDAKANWGDWTWIAEGQATPNSPITAIPIAGTDQFILFTTSLTGGVITTTGGVAGWTPWISVAQGSTAPGQLISAIAISGADQYGLFTTDPNGYTYWIAGNSQGSWGDWTWISKGQTAPRTPVTPVYLPTNEGGQLALFMTGADGLLYMTTQLSGSAWQPWTQIVGLVAKPGTLVSAVTMQPDPLMVFVANAQGEVCTASRSLGPPAAPTGLYVSKPISAASEGRSIINFAWIDNSGGEAGFNVAYEGRLAGYPDDMQEIENLKAVTFAFNVLNGYTYTASVTAVDAAVESAADTISGTIPGQPPVLTAPAGLYLTVTDATDIGVYTLTITGNNFGKNEQVEITVNWIVSGEGAGNPYALPSVITDPLVGSFTTTFSGNSTGGFCPIEEPIGTPQPLQTFKVTAKGLTSGRTASATTTFTCPFSANTLVAHEIN